MQSRIRVSPDGALKLDDRDTNWEKLEVKLKRDKEQGVHTPIKVYAATNVDWTFVGPFLELGDRFERVFEIVMGNEQS